MFDVTKLLKQINTNIGTSTDSYVYYIRDTGILVKITNTYEEENEYSILVTSYNEVEHIITGTRRLDEYRVKYDNDTSSYRLYAVTEISNLSRVNKKLHKINNTYDDNNVDIAIIQDNTNQHWKVKITEAGAVKLKQNIIHIADTISFAIVENSDPNIFYEKIDVDLSIFKTTNIFETEFKYDYSKLSYAPSVYTYKIFSNYGHIINS